MSTATLDAIDLDREVRVGNVERIYEEINRHAVLMYLDFKRYDGQIQATGSRVLVNEAEVGDEMMTKPGWRILPDDWRKAISRVTSRPKRAVRQVGTLFKAGVYMVPRQKFEALYHNLMEYRDQFNEVADRQCLRWPEVLSRARRYIVDKCGEATWGQVERELPTSETVRSKYAMRIGLWPVGGSGTSVEAVGLASRIEQRCRSLKARLDYGNTDGLTDEFKDDLDSLSGLVDSLRATIGGNGRIDVGDLGGYMATAREATEQMLRETLEQQFAEPRRELQESLTALLAAVDGAGSVRGATLARFRQAWDRLESFRWLATEDLQRQLDEIGPRLDLVDRESIRSTETGAQLVESLRSIRESLNSSSSRFLDVG